MFVGNNAVVPKATVNNMIDIKLNKMENKRKKYVSPTVGELGFESEVHLLTVSDRHVEQHVEQNVRFNSALGDKTLDEADDEE